MRRQILSVFLSLLLIAPTVVWSQSIKTDDNIETDAQLVSNVATGTAPLAVSSTTIVENLNADSLDDLDALDFAFYSEFLENQAEIAAHNPDPPCFNNTHRFVDCGNGTVTDTVTGVIWLEDAGCLPAESYAAANATAAALFDGAEIDPSASDCGLTDGSKVGDWRLATKEEWGGILMLSCPAAPKIVGNQEPAPGCYTDATDPNSEWASGVDESSSYWSSTAAASAAEAWFFSMDVGAVDVDPKSDNARVWPVRGRQ
jgi:hypothetical protein